MNFSLTRRDGVDFPIALDGGQWGAHDKLVYWADTATRHKENMFILIQRLSS